MSNHNVVTAFVVYVRKERIIAFLRAQNCVFVVLESPILTVRTKHAARNGNFFYGREVISYRYVGHYNRIAHLSRRLYGVGEVRLRRDVVNYEYRNDVRKFVFRNPVFFYRFVGYLEFTVCRQRDEIRLVGRNVFQYYAVVVYLFPNNELAEVVGQIAAIFIVVLIRVLATKLKWNLPKAIIFDKKDNNA